MCLAAIVLPAQAQPSLDLKRLSLEELGQLEVTTVTKAPELAWRIDAAIHVLTRDDLRRAGVSSVPDALRLVPGVQVARIDSSRWAVGVRGFASQFSQSLLVLVDGRSVYTPMFAGVYWAVQDLLLDDIERIEVIRGPGGTIWGTNAVNGVINIITRSAVDTTGLYAAIAAGNVDRVAGEFRYGARGADGFHYRISARAFDRGPEHHPGHGDFDQWRLGHVSFRGDWNPAARDRVVVTARAYGGTEGKLTASPRTFRRRSSPSTRRTTWLADMCWRSGAVRCRQTRSCGCRGRTSVPRGWGRSSAKIATPSTWI
jgi:iron complex outermembrane receptor protein